MNYSTTSPAGFEELEQQMADSAATGRTSAFHSGASGHHSIAWGNTPSADLQPGLEKNLFDLW
ncbi:MAG: hypothetical protein ACLRIL_07910 [Fusicatenibacter saccharivorans]